MSLLHDPRYLGELGEQREAAAIARWTFAHINDLLRPLGLREGWWCGLMLLRDAIFGDGADGDVDLIVGPLTYDLSEQEWSDRVRAEQRKYGVQPKMPGLHVAAAHHQAGLDGCVRWPPEISYVVACEVKASHYSDRWQATHAAGRRRLLGQLECLREHGVNRAAFLHLAATAPIPGAGDSWDAASSRVDKAAPDFPTILEDEDLSTFGYMRALMGAVEGHSEGLAGVGGALEILAPPPLMNPVVPRPWHASLGERLAAMPRPRGFRTFVIGCRGCGKWVHGNAAEASIGTCGCVRQS